jgi:hypothetical protein
MLAAQPSAQRQRFAFSTRADPFPPPARETPSSEIGTSRKSGLSGQTASRNARGCGKTADSLVVINVSTVIA